MNQTELEKMKNMFIDLYNYTNTFIMDNFPPNDNHQDILDRLDDDRRIQEEMDYYGSIDEKYESRQYEQFNYDPFEEYYLQESEEEYQRQIIYESSSDEEVESEEWTTV